MISFELILKATVLRLIYNKILVSDLIAIKAKNKNAVLGISENHAHLIYFKFKKREK